MGVFETKLAPSILAADFAELGEEIASAQKYGADMIHYDVMDGVFVPSISFGIPVLASLDKRSDAYFDCHLMIVEPDRYVEDFYRAGADSITIHVEACRDTDAMTTLKHIRSLGIKCGISINPKTPVVYLLPFLGMVDMVLIMSVEPGFGGQKFIPESLAKIKEVAALRAEGEFDFDIQVDGGITKDNLSEVLEAGANVIVSGSSIFKGSIEDNIKTFKEIMSR